MTFKIFLVLAFIIAGNVYAQATASRGLITDRPSKTESPHTVLPGAFQFETDLINYAYNKDSGQEMSTRIYNNINLKTGLNNSLDVQLILPTAVKVRTRSLGEAQTSEGFGDAVLRTKYNFFGNGDSSALAVMTYVKLPTAGAGLSNRRVEAGIMFPFATKIFTDWDLGSMIHFDHVRRSDDTGWQTNSFATLSLGHSIIGDLSGFVELFGEVSDNNQQKETATFDVGFTYKLQDNVQLDTGIFFGLTEASDDYQTFAGLSMIFE